MEKEVLILFALVISIGFFKIFLTHPTFSDENFYFNSAKAVLRGEKPYSDFFFAHPPLQIYSLSVVFSIFGLSIAAGKMISMISSSASVFLIYSIGKKIFEEKIGFISSLIFIFSVAFISFSSIEYGFFPTLFFILLSFYFLLEKRENLSAISFLLATFFRYHAIFYLPLFLAYAKFYQKIKIRKYFIKISSSLLILFLILNLFFGVNYSRDTVSYHVFTKIVLFPYREIFSSQYWSISIFFLFLTLISVSTAYKIEKNKKIILIGMFPIFIDFLILLTFQPVFFHYFLLSLPFYSIIIAKGIDLNKDLLTKLFFVIVLLIAIFANIQTIDFYLNPKHSEKFYEVANFVNKTETVFGEPTITNFLAFTEDVKISNRYYDSFIPHLIFDGEKSVIEKLNEEKPKYFIDMEIQNRSYYLSRSLFSEFVKSNYTEVFRTGELPAFIVFERK